MDDVIAKWNKNYNLIDLVIQNLEKYVAGFTKGPAKPAANSDSKFPNRV